MKRFFRFPRQLPPLNPLRGVTRCQKVWVRDLRSRARLRKGVIYPLAAGGAFELIQAKGPGLFSPPKILVRFVGRQGSSSFQWFPAVLSGSDLFVDLPPIDLGRVLSSVRRGL